MLRLDALVTELHYMRKIPCDYHIIFRIDERNLMNYLDWFNALFNLVFFMIGFWTAISWMHKQIYIFKKAQKLKTTVKEKGTKINLLEAFWIVSDYRDYAILKRSFREVHDAESHEKFMENYEELLRKAGTYDLFVAERKE